MLLAASATNTAQIPCRLTIAPLRWVPFESPAPDPLGSPRALLAAVLSFGRFGAFFDDAANEEPDGSIREFQRSADRESPMQMVDPAWCSSRKKVHDGFAVGRIQVSGRLVSKQDKRIAAQGASYGDTLLLTAGELRRVVFHTMRHPHAFERPPARGVCAPRRASRDEPVSGNSTFS